MTKRQPRDAMRIIGIDCATQAKHIGLAVCTLSDGRARLDELQLGTTWEAIDEKVSQWVAAPTILALDAPLGWPAALGQSLSTHHAGNGLASEPNSMFRRATDDAVHLHLNKRPLDVGSDRIARTAHSALSFLTRLRARLDERIPLAWDPALIAGIAAIEVYPAGTLAARRLPHSGYKGSAEPASELRRQLTSAVRKELSLDKAAAELMGQTDHALDAVLCVTAAMDFLSGDVLKPLDLALAKREGWIWVAKTKGE